MKNEEKFQKIISLAKRRGFVWPSSEIYGGFSGFYDFGPLGILLKENLKNEWKKSVVFQREDVLLIDSSIILNPKVWQASGHIKEFIDLMSECPKCKKRFKVDDLEKNICPECKVKLLPPKKFNPMFKTFVGTIEDKSTQAFLRPETAQGIFINFKNVLDCFSKKLPFGIAQIGKAFRNEISPGNFLFRIREFEQMELEYFVDPKEAKKYHTFWIKERFKWYQNLGLSKKNLKLYQVPKSDLAHYSKGTTEVHYLFPFSGKFEEIEGIANRGDYDLKVHHKHSGVDLRYFDEISKKRFFPYVIEPSLGIERVFLALLCEAYFEDKERNRIVLKFLPKLAPIKVAVFPLLANKPKLVKLAQKIYQKLKKEFICVFDDSGNIGKRYYRQDEIGTPFCITVDFQSLEDGTVTLRDRDTTSQIRCHQDELIEILKEKLF